MKPYAQVMLSDNIRVNGKLGDHFNADTHVIESDDGYRIMRIRARAGGQPVDVPWSLVRGAVPDLSAPVATAVKRGPLAKGTPSEPLD